tara:strand:+ start:2065 stop:2580 length:516 start_codon:yes stop_codon:yes gene_type:complete
LRKDLNYKQVNLRNPLTWFAVGFGTGFSPFVPGTLGSLLALVLFYFLIVPFLKPFAYSFVILFYLFLVLISFFLGLFLYVKTMGEKKDAKIFVWDEFVGMWIALFPLVIWDLFCLWCIFLSFLSFRFFDILKLGPISYFDKLGNPFGVMMDDVIAGLFSASILTLLLLVFY